MGKNNWFCPNNKYNSQQITLGEEKFDSIKEYHRFCELSMMEKAGLISDLKRQVKFILIPTQREPDTIGKRGGIKKGKLLEKEVAYYADFVYYMDGFTVVEDTKGMRTTDYILKRKLMLYVHGIKIQEI